MRAAVCREYGPPEVIQVSDVPSPAVEDGQVRVRVGAAAVNFPDVLFMANRYQLTIPVPFVPGSEFAGVVTEIGPGVSDVCAGDRVMGTTTVGASVTAVASSDAKLSVASAYGASGLINHRSAAGGLRQALRAAFPDGTDAVIDPVGGDLAEPALRALRWGGRFVTVGYASGTVPRIPLNPVLLKGCRILGFQFRDFAAHAPDELARNEAALLELFAAGRALPHIGATFKLAEAAAALRHVADGKAIGKVVLAIG